MTDQKAPETTEEKPEITPAPEKAEEKTPEQIERDELMKEAKELGLSGLGNAKIETIKARIEEAKAPKAPETMRAGSTEKIVIPESQVIVTHLLKKGITGIAEAGKPLPPQFQTPDKIAEFKRRGII